MRSNHDYLRVTYVRGLLIEEFGGISGKVIFGPWDAPKVHLYAPLDVRTKFRGSKKSQIRVCYSKMLGCEDNPLVRSIFSWDKLSPYKWDLVYTRIICSV